MLDKQQLLEQVNTTLTKTKVVKLTTILKETEFKLADLIDLTFHDDKKTAFRAAWLLENWLLLSPEIYLNNLPYFINKFPLVTYKSCMRHYAKIAMRLTSPKMDKSIKNAIADIDIELVVNQCFDWIIDPKVLIAVKAFAAEALFNLIPRYPWIKHELKEQLQFLMKNGTAAIQSRGKKLLAKM